MANDKLSVTIRMYRQGLGDSFLLTFRTADKPDVNMLIDCGLLQHTAGEDEIMKAVASSIAKAAGGKLDAVVMTHEHWDHISGFSQARALFDTIAFDRVWVGWTENDSHPQAAKLRERFKKQLQGMNSAIEKMGKEIEQRTRIVGIDGTGEAAKRLQEMRDLHDNIKPLINEFFGAEMFGAASKDLGRSATWQHVMERSTAKPKYCEPGKVETIEGLEGVRFHILGPPADFEKFTQTEPKKGQERDSYRDTNKIAFADSLFAAVTGEKDTLFPTESSQPFDRHLRIAKKDARRRKFFKQYYFSNDINPENEFRNIDDDWMMALSSLALNIDSYTNNTCLAFAIELVETGKMLVFPGDAQFGNWLSWQDLSWEVKDPDGTKRTITIKDIFDRTVFYKVGHHGSHNATLREHGLQMMNNPELVAMVPVDRAAAAQQGARIKETIDGMVVERRKGWDMPEAHLFEDLQQRAKGRVIMLDEKDNTELSKRCSRFQLPDTEKVKFLQKVIFGPKDTAVLDGAPLYIEYTIE